jgi:hypothetical protein
LPPAPLPAPPFSLVGPLPPLGAPPEETKTGTVPVIVTDPALAVNEIFPPNPPAPPPLFPLGAPPAPPVEVKVVPAPEIFIPAGPVIVIAPPVAPLPPLILPLEGSAPFPPEVVIALAILTVLPAPAVIETASPNFPADKAAVVEAIPTAPVKFIAEAALTAILPVDTNDNVNALAKDGLAAVIGAATVILPVAAVPPVEVIVALPGVPAVTVATPPVSVTAVPLRISSISVVLIFAVAPLGVNVYNKVGPAPDTAQVPPLVAAALIVTAEF